MDNRCVSCGEIIPEGMIACPNCLVVSKKKTEMKPCPFCGSEDIRKITTCFDCMIFCANCKANMRRENFIICDSIAETLKEAEPQAIEAWNRRCTDAE